MTRGRNISFFRTCSGTASGRDPCNGSKGPYHFFGSKAEEANNKILDYIAKH